MLRPDQMHGYQKKAVNFQCSHNASAIWADMGLGKTIITLSSIQHLMLHNFLRGVLVVAPIRVVRLVWRQEALKWTHTKDMTFSVITGTKDQRTRALLRKADVYLINYENLRWLAEMLFTYYIKKDRQIPFNGVVWDEISKMKNSTTKRVSAFGHIMGHIDWTTGLTGTPAANGYKDLHGQYLVLDKGYRLGTSKTEFERRFYYKEKAYKIKAYPDTENTIKALIGDITLQMSAEDYNPLPDMIVNDVMVELPPALRAKYDELEKNFFFELDNGTGVEVFNKASMTNKCIAEGTEVLTPEGWVPIEQYKGQLVWDGVEWVNTSGLAFNGYKYTINCYDVLMTPDHKVLTVDGWKQAHEVADGESSERYDRSKVRLPDGYKQEWEQEKKRWVFTGTLEGPVLLRDIVDDDWSEPPHEHKPSEVVRMYALRGNHEGPQGEGCRSPRYDRHSPVRGLVKHEVKVQQSIGQGLSWVWCAWDKGLRKMGELVCKLLGRHGLHLQTPFDYRENGQQPWLFSRQLPVAQHDPSGKQPSVICPSEYSNRSYNSGTGCEEVWSETNHHLQASGTGRLRYRSNSTCRVYDLINAGPRNRFTVRGADGRPLIVHNCLQFSSGFVYPIPGLPQWERIHDIKLDALEDIVEEAAGSQVLCGYAYRADAERIMKRFKNIRPINLTECKSEKSLNDAMARWKGGDCPLMIGHPASMGHGVDGLQDAGHILAWFGGTWSLDLYKQFNARLRRQGQGRPVMCHRIMTRDTLDVAQSMAIEEKDETEVSLRNAIKEYRQMRGH